MAGIEWTTDELLVLENNYHTGLSCQEMSVLLPNRTISAIHSKASLLNLKSSYASGRKYEYDKFFFDKFTKESCYWAGFLAADGCVMHIDGYKLLRVEIKEKYHLQKFLDCMSSDTPIHFSRKKQLHAVTLSISNDCAESLKNNFNIIPRKTYVLKFPDQIPYNLIPYFLIGYIDGDGCWHRSRTTRKFSLSIVSASEDILIGIGEWVKNNYESAIGKPRNITKTKPKETYHYHFTVGGVAAANLFLDLRTYIPEMHLSRKWDVPEYIDCCDAYSKKFPVVKNKFIPQFPP